MEERLGRYTKVKTRLDPSLQIEVFDLSGRGIVADIPADNSARATRWVARAGQPPVGPYETVIWAPDESLCSGVYLVCTNI